MSYFVFPTKRFCGELSLEELNYNLVYPLSFGQSWNVADEIWLAQLTVLIRQIKDQPEGAVFPHLQKNHSFEQFSKCVSNLSLVVHSKHPYDISTNRKTSMSKVRYLVPL